MFCIIRTKTGKYAIIKNTIFVIRTYPSCLFTCKVCSYYIWACNTIIYFTVVTINVSL